MNKFLFALLLLFAGCYRAGTDLEPKINYTLQDKYLKQLPSPFSPLTSEEKSQDFGKEYLIGLRFAKELDFYRAVTAFKRAEILAPENALERKLELNYEILLCYYLGRKYEEVDRIFTNGPLRHVSVQFPAFRDLIIILYDTYHELKDTCKMNQMLELIKQQDPDTYKKIILSQALVDAHLCQAKEIAATTPQKDRVLELIHSFEQEKKSIDKAKWYNALLPGAGYLYIGQKQTALTAFLVNGLFIAAAVHFFQKNEIAAGIITTSFEAGWYFGGIYGAAQEAKLYNERLYERKMTPFMNQQGLFPAFMLNYAF